MKYDRSGLCLATVLILLANIFLFQAHASDNFSSSSLKILPDSSTTLSLTDYLQSEIAKTWLQWQKDFETRDPAEYQDHYKYLKTKFIEQIGGLPERTALNPVITGSIKRTGYRVEKIIFESRPKHFVTAALFLPDSPKYKPPYPGVLIPCGHSENAKAHDEYQSMGALCALNGMAALVFDPIDQGERIQMLDESGNVKLWGTRSHNLSGIQAILLGKNIAQNEIWDGMRSLDYLISRSEVNSQLVGITGNSGGGTQTSYLFMLDERLKVAAPSCYLHNLNSQTKYSMGDAEQNIFGQLKFGLDHPDYIMSRAPAPAMILAATNDFFRIDAVWETFRYLKRYYTTLGYAERINILENNAGHNYNKTQRESAVRWLSRWLLNIDQPITEPDLQLLTDLEMQCTPEGSVTLLDGYRSVHDMHIELYKKLEADRNQFLKNDRNKIKTTIKELLSIDDFISVKPSKIDTTGIINRNAYNINKILITDNRGIKLPALQFVPKDQKSGQEPILFLSQYGKSYHFKELDELARQGKTVLAVDLHGTGETAQNGKDHYRLSQYINWADCNRAYLLGKSIVGMRLEDILTCVNYLSSINHPEKNKVELIAIGEVCTPALHAAFLYPDKISKSTLRNSLVSWANVIKNQYSINQLSNTIHGVLKYYDIPDLIKFMRDKIIVEEPYDAVGLPFGKSISEMTFSDEPEFEGLAGILYGRINFSNPDSPDPLLNLDCTWDNAIQKRGRDWASKWSGYLLSPFNGEVEIKIYSNQKVNLKIGNLIEETVGYNLDEKTIQVTLEQNKTYPISIEYSQDGVDKSFMKITWRAANGEEKVISSEYLSHSQAQRFHMENDWK
jgi:dienelactone hydrolase